MLVIAPLPVPAVCAVSGNPTFTHILVLPAPRHGLGGAPGARVPLVAAASERAGSLLPTSEAYAGLIYLSVLASTFKARDFFSMNFTGQGLA